MKGFARILSVFLSMLMVLYLVPAEVYSLKTGATELAIDNIEATDNVLSTETAEVTALGEDLSKRTASSKTIRMSDGSYRLVQYASDVHYEDDGEWLEYDNSLSLSSASSSGTVAVGGITAGEPIGYQPTSNPGGLKFGQNTTGDVLSFSEGGKKLAMSIQCAKSATIVTQEKSVDVISLDKFEEIVTIENYSSSVLYSSVFDNAHIRYTASGSSVKEDIIVFKKADSYVYSFDFTLTGLEAELLPDGGIAFNDTITDEMMYYIPVGYMYDSSDNASSAVSYSLTQTASGCTVTVTADAEWINADERVFPVVIDPTVYRTNHSQYSNMKDVDISTAYSATGSTSTWAYMYAGNKSGKEYHSLVGIKELPTLPEASVVTKATLTLKSLEQSGTPIIAAYAVKTPWEAPTVRWSDLDNKVLVYDTNVVDYQKIESIGEEYVFDITSLAQEWYGGNAEGKSSANGVVLKAYSNTANTYAKFSTINNYTAGNNYFTPLFTIQYRDTKGIEARWSYNSQSAGNAGIGSVNLFTGNLVFAHDDITTNGEILPLAVSHVYNSHQAAQQYEYRKDTINNTTPVYGGATVGNGFKLSIQETIAVETIDNNTWYVYNDADGTELYFFKPTGKTEYISEDGYDLTIVKSNGIYTMKDKVGNTKKFNSNGTLYEQKDLHGNKKTITYTTNGRISTVTHTPSGGTAKTQLEFVYNGNGALYRIINAEDADEYVTFYYSTTHNGTESISNAGYLRSIRYSKSSIVSSYEYYGNGLLKSATNRSESGTVYNRVEYSYDASLITSGNYARVQKATEYGENNIQGQSIGFIYGVETTAVRTSGNDDIYGNTDDLLTHYVFDDHGRTISAYSTNLSGTEVYGASNAEYSPTEQGSKKNHTITKDSVSGVPAMNLLKDPSAELYGVLWASYHSGTGYSSTLVNTEHFIGNYSFKLSSTGGGGFIERRQSVTITEEGDYTLSAYVKLQNLNATTGFYLELGGVSSRKLKVNTDANIQNGWQRLSVTTYLEAGTYDARAILQNATGTAYVDCLQLEKGKGASKYNLITNGGIIGGTSGWMASGAAYSNGRIKLSGDPSTAVSAYQTIKLNLPLTTTFVLSGWAEANSVARRLPESEDDTPERNFDIVATLTYNNGDTEDTAVSFNTDSTALQFASGAVVAKEKEGRTSITSVKVELRYDNNANTAFFDNICLAMEPAQTYSYDSEGNLTSATNAEGNKIGAEYYSNNIDLKSYTSIIGETYTYEYNSKHMVTESTRTGTTPITTTYSYDQYGNQTAEVVTNADGSLSVSAGATYDSYGKTLTVTDSRGNETVYSYNNYTELLQYVQTANSARTAYVYDNKDRITSIYNDIDRDGVKDTSEQFVSYEYNNKNQLESIETDNTLYTLTYDSFGNSSSVKAGNYTLATYEYNDKNGKLLGTTYGNGFTVTNVYDLLDRLVAVKYNNTVAYTVTYNGNGSVSCITDVLSGRSTDYEYDSLGRLIRAEQYITSSGISLLKTENQYDAYGRAKSSTYQVNGKNQEYAITYKPNSSLISTFSSAIAANKDIITEFNYDSLDRLASKISHIGAVSKTESYEYLTDGTSTTSLVSKHTVDGVEYSYTYDSVGNITAVYKNGKLKYKYTYDKLNQLTEAIIYSDNYDTDILADIYEYVYDKSGNITFVVHQYGESVSYGEGFNYTYGNSTWGDLLTNYNGTAITYDAIGNPLKWRNAQMLEWQGRNLTLFANTNGEMYTYTYNADGIRTSKNYYNAGGNLIGTDEYIYDGTKLIAENRSGTWLYYFYDANGTVTGMYYNNVLYYFRKNLQGDVTGIYNATGALVVEYEYTPYGAPLTITNGSGTDVSTNVTHIANINPFRYRGYYYDTETELYYLITRYYDPVVGRFLNADVYTSTGKGFVGNNMFAYCLNNPVNMIDIDGRDPTPQWATRIINGEGTEEDYMIAFIIDPSPWAGFARTCIDKAIEIAYEKYNEYEQWFKENFSEWFHDLFPTPQELACQYFIRKNSPLLYDWLYEDSFSWEDSSSFFDIALGTLEVISGGIVMYASKSLKDKLAGAVQIVAGVKEIFDAIVQLFE